jgi:DNA-binding FadR family transcriptional regulator
MRAIRVAMLRLGGRAELTMPEHAAIVEGLKRRDADLASRLVRDHGLGLAAHVEQHGVFPE